MVTDDLIIYIEKQLGKNISKDLITSRLTQIGWRREDVEEGFAQIDLKKNPPSNFISLDVPFIEQLTNLTVAPHVDTVKIEDKKSEKIDGTLMVNLQQEVLKKIEELKKEDTLKIESLKKEQSQKIEALKIEALKQEEILKQEANVKQEALKKETIEKIEALKKDEALKQEIIKQETLKKAEALKEEKDREEEAQKEKETKRLEALKQQEILKQEDLKKIEDLKQETLKREDAQKKEEIKQYIQKQEELKKQNALNQAALQKAEAVKQELPKIAEPVKIWTPTNIPVVEKIEENNNINKQEEFLPTLAKKSPEVTSTLLSPITPIKPIIPPVQVAPSVSSAPVYKSAYSISSTPKTVDIPRQSGAPRSFSDFTGEKLSSNINSQKESSAMLGNKQSVINDLSKQAMISTYSQDFLSASRMQENPSTTHKNVFAKIIITILVLGCIGGAIFAFMNGIIKIPGINLSLGNNPKTLLANVPDIFSQIKSYKVESVLKVSILPDLAPASITSSLITGQDIKDSISSDVFIISTKGVVEKDGEYKSDFTTNIKSSTWEGDVNVNLKKFNDNSFVSVSDFSKIFGYDFPQIGMINIPNNKAYVAYGKLASVLAGQSNNQQIDQSILSGIFNNNENDTALIFKEFIKNVQINKKGSEIIHGVNTSDYSIVINDQTGNQLLTELSGILLKGSSSENKMAMSNLIKSVSVNSLDVWIGKDDNNIYQYQLVLKMPVSKISASINNELVNNEIIFDLKYAYYDFDVANDITMPESAISVEDFIIAVKDSKLKQTASNFKTYAQELFGIQKNYGKIANTNGSCETPALGSIFSPLGDLIETEAVSKDIISAMTDINLLTNNTAICYSNSKAWAISLALQQNSSEFYCVDSKNESPKITTNILSGTVCN